MKVRLIHPERRTAHSIQLTMSTEQAAKAGGRKLPAKLKPTQRCELALKPGENLSFNAALAGKLGEVPFLLELETDNEAPLFMCLVHGDVEKRDIQHAPQPACRSFNLSLTLQAGREHSFSMTAPGAVHG
jgi:hypothetical protein